jgi:hypothetical protein
MQTAVIPRRGPSTVVDPSSDQPGLAARIAPGVHEGNAESRIIERSSKPTRMLLKLLWPHRVIVHKFECHNASESSVNRDATRR